MMQIEKLRGDALNELFDAILTLENREDLKNQAFNDICEDIFDNEISIHDIPEKFTFLIEEEHPRLRKKDKSIRSGTATVADDEPIIDSNTEDGNVY